MTGRTPRFSGVIPPLVTPIGEDGEVDEPSLERLVSWLIGSGVHGLFVLGSSAETAYLADRQRQRILDVVVKTAAGQIPILAGCIGTATNRVIEQVRSAEKAGADAVVATAPVYALVGDEEIITHFRQIAATTDLPLLAYDVPASVPHRLSRTGLEMLARDGVVVGIKDSSGDDVTARMRMMSMADLPEFSHLTGHEVVVDAMLLAGMDGAVPGLGNLDPHGYVRLYDAARAGRWDQARVEQDRLARLFSIVDIARHSHAGHNSAGLGAFKAGLVERGIITSSRMSPPMHCFTAAEQKSVARELDRAGLR